MDIKLDNNWAVYIFEVFLSEMKLLKWFLKNVEESAVILMKLGFAVVWV